MNSLLTNSQLMFHSNSKIQCEQRLCCRCCALQQSGHSNAWCEWVLIRVLPNWDGVLPFRNRNWCGYWLWPSVHAVGREENVIRNSDNSCKGISYGRIKCQYVLIILLMILSWICTHVKLISLIPHFMRRCFLVALSTPRLCTYCSIPLPTTAGQHSHPITNPVHETI